MIRRPKRPASIKSIEGVLPPAIKHSKKFKTRFLSKKAIFLYAAILVLITAGGISFALFYGKSTDLNNVEVIKQKISRHMLLPNNEQPALATVTDKSKLTTPFLKKTENGDKLLIYQKNQRAIIYRPSIDKIVDVGPVSIDTLPSSQ